jgi:homoserine kinase type II
MTRPNDLGPAGWRRLYERSRARADSVHPDLAGEIAAELEFLEAAWPGDLPAGVIHADLFPDNVFFRDHTLSGLIDFYFACTDFLAYDLAICLNAWCFEPDASFNVTKARLLVARYRAVRPLDPAELAALPLLARGSALRFLLTRLYDWLNQLEGALVRPKDPLEYLRKMRFHRTVADAGAYGIDG